jgi:hypothetical protein
MGFMKRQAAREVQASEARGYLYKDGTISAYPTLVCGTPGNPRWQDQDDSSGKDGKAQPFLPVLPRDPKQHEPDSNHHAAYPTLS